MMKDRMIELPRQLDFRYHKNLADYTKPELDRFRELCNFTDEETNYFNLRSNAPDERTRRMLDKWMDEAERY